MTRDYGLTGGQLRGLTHAGIGDHWEKSGLIQPANKITWNPRIHHDPAIVGNNRSSRLFEGRHGATAFARHDRRSLPPCTSIVPYRQSVLQPRSEPTQRPLLAFPRINNVSDLSALGELRPAGVGSRHPGFGEASHRLSAGSPRAGTIRGPIEKLAVRKPALL